MRPDPELENIRVPADGLDGAGVGPGRHNVYGVTTPCPCPAPARVRGQVRERARDITPGVGP